jgi:hypothetical protein
MPTAQFTRFRVRRETVPSVLDARRAWVTEAQACQSFRGGLLVALEDGEWLDVSIWDLAPPGVQAGAKPSAGAEFVDRIDSRHVEILGQESGTVTSIDSERTHTGDRGQVV